MHIDDGKRFHDLVGRNTCLQREYTNQESFVVLVSGFAGRMVSA